jgi:molecular chaperone HtpG
MSKKKLTIHTENILPIIKKWLYSDKDIFLRELISNACDAIQKCRTLREHQELDVADDTFRIDVIVDKEARTIKLIDNGIGMSKDEVEKYIAQVAFSGAEEFLGKYKSANEKDQIIGHFGLGFYSSYMVASTVTIDTLSYRPNEEAALWSCDGSSEYLLETGKRETRGTEITLHVDKESDEFLEESKLRSMLQHYCSFLPFPIYLNNTHINEKEPLWLKNSSECTEQEYLDFYRALYPMEQDPIFWIHLNVDYPFHLKGILYFPKISRRFDWNQNTIKLFCNRVFVSDNCKDLIPDYLMVLRGAIDSPDIPLNVSRSALQMDRTVRQLAQHISKKVSDRLASLFLTDRETFIKAWPDIEIIIKLGMLQDEKFYERSKEFLLWKTLDGEWTTVEQYLERHKEAYKGKVYYTSEENPSGQFLSLYKEKGIEILLASAVVDTPVINLLEEHHPGINFQRLDGAIDENMLDPSREKTLLDANGKSQAINIAEYIRSQLPKDNLTVEAKSLVNDSVPAFFIVDEQLRRMRETLALSQQVLPPSITSKRTFVVNTNNKLIQAIYGLQEKDPALSGEMIHHLYDLSLLSQKELDAASLSEFVARSNRLMEKISVL